MEEHEILFRKFMDDKSIYNLNVGYWRMRIEQVINDKITHQDELVSNRRFSGKRIYDGNPIFSHYNKSKNKGVRIIQHDPFEYEPIEDLKDLQAWLDVIHIPIDEERDKEIPELVVSIFLTRTSVAKCQRLVSMWYAGTLNNENLEGLINEQI